MRGCDGPSVRPLPTVRFPGDRRPLPRLPHDPAGALVFRAGDDRRAEARSAGRGLQPRRRRRCRPPRTAGTPPEYPALVWVGAPHVVTGVRLTADATALEDSNPPLRVELVPRIP